jgi:hypothetical protein
MTGPKQIVFWKASRRPDPGFPVGGSQHCQTAQLTNAKPKMYLPAFQRNLRYTTNLFQSADTSPKASFGFTAISTETFPVCLSRGQAPAKARLIGQLFQVALIQTKALDGTGTGRLSRQLSPI